MTGSDDLLRRYNYDVFVREKVDPWMRFHESPPLGQPAPDFPLWRLEDGPDAAPTSLKAIWSAHRYTIVEFGSFT